MSETELCRLCVNVADQTNAENVFEKNHRKLLRQIEELMGRRLKISSDLPQHICKPCEERTMQAHEFRAQCIRAQQHFESCEQRNLTFKEQVPAIEEVVLNELYPVKEEEEEFNDDGASPLSQITEVLFKNEPTKTNDNSNLDDDSDDDNIFNPLDEDYQNQHTTDEEEEEKKKEGLLTIEPEISLFADEKPLLTKTKLEPGIKQKSNRRKRSKNEKQNTSSITKEKNFICDQCGRHFVCISMLDTHMRRHTGERMFKCEICPESFFLNADLKRHILKHAGVLPYPCSHCDRRFLDKSHAKKHERTHTNERPFVCQQCGKAFTVSHILQDHMVTHTGERAFGCKMCNVAFKRKTHLITHYRSMTHKQNEEKYRMNVNN